jgi:shikimate dehydrogenase
LPFEVRFPLPYNQRVSDAPKDWPDANTRYCAVFGHPIRHSASPAMQNAGFAALRLNWRYLACDVHPDRLRAAIEGTRVMGFIGLNLTVPHKRLAVDMVDLLDDQARAWGAVNTIVFETRDGHGHWAPRAAVDAGQAGEVRSRGCNTDADAIVRSLQEEFSRENWRGAAVLLLGAGGAARSTALRLAQEQIGALCLANRTPARAAELAAEIAGRFPKIKLEVSLLDAEQGRQLRAAGWGGHPNVALVTGYPTERIDLVINATSLGLKADDPLPIPAEWLRSHRPSFVYDMIYRPRETGLLRVAREAGCRAANGAGMLLYQGARALELWAGRPAPLDVMRSALEENLKSYV